ncbi:MAG: transcription-repair coupling factor, partial [Candidatus Melainabacteria bacterium]|nr:transcription-repair coupling factor [Candidatus Melainabacteria bacterium]
MSADRPSDASALPENQHNSTTPPAAATTAVRSSAAVASAAEAPTTPAGYLLTCFERSGWLGQLVARIQAHQRTETGSDLAVDQVNNTTLKALVLASLLGRFQRPVVVVSGDPQESLRLQSALTLYLKPEAIARYPMESFSPYDLSTPSPAILKAHYDFCQYLQEKPASVFLLSARNLLMRHPALTDRQAFGITLKPAGRMEPDDLAAHCLAMGYSSTSLVLEPGEFSRRGDIVDIYPVNAPPVRLSFFGDVIETLRRMDVDNQRSVERLASVTILPRTNLVLTPEHQAQLPDKLNACLSRQKSKLDPLDFEGLQATVANQIQALEQSFWPDGLDYYAPLCHPEFETLIDGLPTGSLMVFDDWSILQNQLDGLTDRLNREYEDGLGKGRLLDIDFCYHLTGTEALAAIRQRLANRLLLDALPLFTAEEGGAPEASGIQPMRLSVEPAERFQADLAAAVAKMGEWRQQGYEVMVSTDYPQRVLDLCKEQDVPAEYWPEEGVDLAKRGTLPRMGREVIVSRAGALDGFVLPELRLVQLTDAELFGRKRHRRMSEDPRGGGSKRKDDVDVIQSITELRQGDFVVHSKHGIGQFQALSQIKIDGEVREYLTILYAKNDTLHVPVDQVNLLSRYRGAGDTPPKLNKMGGAEWSSVKRKVKRSIQSIAKELVALYAAREKTAGVAFEMDSPWQVEMEDAFPYTETPDQWQAIADVKKDMETPKPMDRLICGDVGFGKTEVALRAIFKAVLSGKQAAILVPTTILAQQHFNTCVERFNAFPVKIGLLSRFRSVQEQREVIRRLQSGDCDVVVGTHRLLSTDVVFKDLGLLVIDEEHRFGVSHKEKIKQMRNQVDVLTMSATPIPRTLYMSISGVRQMSLINTPPTNRSPVQTFVGPYNPAQIRMAILKEVDRGGQVFFVHNRVQTIYTKAEELQQLVPEVRIGVAHGQMNETDLENMMLAFSQREFDVLLCTTIIENGVDIPTANTMVIDRADRFGLAQLYQLRGRVGRSDVQAYAYCYYDPERLLSEDAKNRLRAIREFTALGSGYHIALRDMEIRGVGNILGAEQHGHMMSVGFDMYCDMLQDEIEAAQEGREVEEKAEASIIDLNVTAFIPTAWVGDADVKLTEYKRLANIDSERALDIIQAEWVDRFGAIPTETHQLVNLTRLRIQATDLGIPLVRADDTYLRISVPYGLQEWMKLQNQLSPKLGKPLRWVAPVRAKESSLPTLLLRHQAYSPNQMVQFLLALFKELKTLKA